LGTNFTPLWNQSSDNIGPPETLQLSVKDFPTSTDCNAGVIWEESGAAFISNRKRNRY